MNKDIEDLLQQSAEYLREFTNDDLFNKVKGNAEPGSKVEITFKGQDEPDKGYIFTLPGQDVGEGDYFIHITDTVDGTDPGHFHIIKLLENDYITEIKIL